jgi:hypothetical protein
MNEDFATKAWAENHEKLSSGIYRTFRTVMDAMAVLHAKQYDAPWRQVTPPRDCTSC